MHYSTGLIQINVTDGAAARAFYIDTFGFREHPESIGGKVLMLDNPGGPPILLYPATKSVPVDYPEQTGVTLVFYIEDIDGIVADWRTKGVELIPISWSEEESGIAPCPFGRFIAFRDPFGNVHEILEPWGEDGEMG